MVILAVGNAPYVLATVILSKGTSTPSIYSLKSKCMAPSFGRASYWAVSGDKLGELTLTGFGRNTVAIVKHLLNR